MAARRRDRQEDRSPVRARRLLAELARDADAELAEHAGELLEAELERGRWQLDSELAGAVDQLEESPGGWFGGDRSGR